MEYCRVCDGVSGKRESDRTKQITKGEIQSDIGHFKLVVYFHNLYAYWNGRAQSVCKEAVFSGMLSERRHHHDYDKNQHHRIFLLSACFLCIKKVQTISFSWFCTFIMIPLYNSSHRNNTSISRRFCLDSCPFGTGVYDTAVPDIDAHMPGAGRSRKQRCAEYGTE